MDYHQLNQVVTPTAAARPGVASLLEGINVSPGIRYDLENPFLLRPISKDLQKQFSFCSHDQLYTCTALPQGFICSLLHNLIYRGA